MQRDADIQLSMTYPVNGRATTGLPSVLDLVERSEPSVVDYPVLDYSHWFYYVDIHIHLLQEQDSLLREINLMNGNELGVVLPTRTASRERRTAQCQTCP